MRSILGTFLVLVITTTSMAGETFPYKVAVNTNGATIRSGPGTKFYPTGKLDVGEDVEVYQRKAGGWLAVRPPQGSFSWIAANKIRTTDDPDVAKVVGTNVVSWVGSELKSVADHRWQVQLDAGESIQLMSKTSMKIYRTDSTRDFYKIAPPAGEFRWIHEDDLQPLMKNRAATESRSEIELTQFQVDLDQIAVAQTPEVTARGDGFVARDDSVAPRVASLAPRQSFQPRDIDPLEFAAFAKRLDLRLSATVAQDPSQWRLVSLVEEAETLVNQSQTTLHRGKAKLLLEKIKEFETLQQRYAGIDEPASDSPQSVTETTSTEPAEASSRSGFDPRFDGRGWLLPVHSSRQASPPYALLDKDGKILSFVSPAPGLNLNRYLRKEVGVFGQKSRALFLKKPHLTADRIVDIDRHRQ
jgi:hypothetical protein